MNCVARFLIPDDWKQLSSWVRCRVASCWCCSTCPTCREHETRLCSQWARATVSYSCCRQHFFWRMQVWPSCLHEKSHYLYESMNQIAVLSDTTLLLGSFKTGSQICTKATERFKMNGKGLGVKRKGKSKEIIHLDCSWQECWKLWLERDHKIHCILGCSWQEYRKYGSDVITQGNRRESIIRLERFLHNVSFKGTRVTSKFSLAACNGKAGAWDHECLIRSKRPYTITHVW